jgi:hypothetical protein
MTRLRLNPKDRQALRLGAFIVLPALLLRFGVVPYVTVLRDVREELRAERDLLFRELDLITEARSYPDAFRLAGATFLQEAPRLFDGADEMLAASDIDAYVSEIGRMNGITVQRAGARPSEPVVDGVIALRLELKGQGDLEGILSFLRAMETGPKLIHIERLALVLESVPTPGMMGPSHETLNFSGGLRAYAIAPDTMRGGDRLGGRP